MSLNNSQYDALMRAYNQKQLKNKHEQDEHIRIAYEKIPRLQEIDEEIASLSLKKARVLLMSSSEPDFDLSASISALSEERTALLQIHGFPADYLERKYDCPLCKDTGYIENQKCSCFKKAAVDLLYTQSNIREILKTENFENFSFEYYPQNVVNPATGLSALETAQDAVNKSWDFIEQFSRHPRGLFFYGDTGVGKTFLSHCIAKELIDRSYFVLYFSAFDFFNLLAKNTFQRDDTASDMAEYISGCDLLIIDDLGTELTNSFVASQLFFCINDRITNRKSTIISTNLAMEDFLETYSERIFSRISSNYTMLKLIGNDIRIQKKLLGGK
ncbi:MAG: ATP-binding protein [Blautia sp.]